MAISLCEIRQCQAAIGFSDTPPFYVPVMD